MQSSSPATQENVLLYQSIRRDARIGYALVCTYPDVASRHGYFTEIGHYNPRPLNESHVKTVLTSFDQNGLLNKVAEHAISYTVDRKASSRSWQEQQRAVDAHTPLLPQSADASGIPLLEITTSSDGALSPLFLFAGQHRLEAARRHHARMHGAYTDCVRVIDSLDPESPEDAAKLPQLQQAAAEHVRLLEENAVWLAEILDKGTSITFIRRHVAYTLIDRCLLITL